MDFLETLGKILIDFKTFSPIICGDDVTVVLHILKMHSIAELYILLTQSTFALKIFLHKIRKLSKILM